MQDPTGPTVRFKQITKCSCAPKVGTPATALTFCVQRGTKGWGNVHTLNINDVAHPNQRWITVDVEVTAAKQNVTFCRSCA